MRIFTNTTALTVQKDMVKSRNTVSDAISRLSSGLRINTAKDDAAGLAIANRMSSGLRGNNAAQRNVKDGISLVNTAMSSIDEVNANFQRIRELQIQYMNETNSEADLESINLEITERYTEVDRIFKSSNFNGIPLFETGKVLSLQIGADVDDTYDIKLMQSSRPALRLNTTRFSKPLSEYTFAGVKEPVEFRGITKADGTVMSREATAARFGVEPHEISIVNMSYLGTEKPILKVGDRFMHITSWDTDPVSGVKSPRIEATTKNVTYTDTTSGIVNAPRTAEAWPLFGMDRNGLFFDYYDFGNRNYAIDNNNPIRSGPGMNNVKLSNPANVMLDRLDQTIELIVNKTRTKLGAIANRLESIDATLTSETLNLAAAQSRIQDADYAVEISNLTRGQILQQAGQAVLAQANQIPQGILSLLR